MPYVAAPLVKEDFNVSDAPEAPPTASIACRLSRAQGDRLVLQDPEAFSPPSPGSPLAPGLPFSPFGPGVCARIVHLDDCLAPADKRKFLLHDDRLGAGFQAAEVNEPDRIAVLVLLGTEHAADGET